MTARTNTASSRQGGRRRNSRSRGCSCANGGRWGHTHADGCPCSTGAQSTRSSSAGAAGVASRPPVGRRCTAAGRRGTEVQTGEGHVPSHSYADADADSNTGGGRFAQPRRVQVAGRGHGDAGGGGVRQSPVGRGHGRRRRSVEHGSVRHAPASFLLLLGLLRGLGFVADAVGPRRPTGATTGCIARAHGGRE